MTHIPIPEKIFRIIGNQEYTLNSIGMSGAEVRLYRDYVLKIQPHDAETDNFYAISKWVDRRIPLPDVIAYCVEREVSYTLMTKADGEMLCSEQNMKNPRRVISLTAQGLKQMWEIDIRDCPCHFSRLDERLKAAEYNVTHGLVNLDIVEGDNFEHTGFQNPIDLLTWLRNNRPPEDIVFTHGDYCLPNIFVKNQSINALIDLGKAGPADRWQDISIAIRSLRHNFDGKYNNGIKLYDFSAQMLLDELDLSIDEHKFRYYYLLDELF